MTAEYVYTCARYGEGTRVSLVAGCSDDRSGAAAQPDDQVCHPQGR